MRETFSAIWQAASTLIGLAVFLAIMYLAARLHSRMWRHVAARYAGRAGHGIARKVPETIIIARRADAAFRSRDYRLYPAAILTLQNDALALSLVPPLNIFCSPLQLPFDDMSLARTDWALWPEPFAIRMQRLPDIDIIVSRDTVRWIRSHTEASPFGLGLDC